MVANILFPRQLTSSTRDYTKTVTNQIAVVDCITLTNVVNSSGIQWKYNNASVEIFKVCKEFHQLCKGV